MNSQKILFIKSKFCYFPEYGAREYYKLVFGRLLFWMMMFLLAFYLFSLGKQFIDNWKEVRLRENKAKATPADKGTRYYRQATSVRAIKIKCLG